MRGSCIVSQLQIAIISIFSTNSGNGLLNENFFFYTSKLADSFGLSKLLTGLRINLLLGFFKTSESKHLLETPGSSIQLRTM